MPDSLSLSRVERLLQWLAFTPPDQCTRLLDCTVTEQAPIELIGAALESYLLPAVVNRYRSDWISRHSAEPSGAPVDADARLAGLLKSFAYRRTAQRKQLLHVLKAWNEVGITPVLLGATRDLWLDANHWRVVRQVTVQVPQADYRTAVGEMKYLGYRQVRDFERSLFREQSLWFSGDTSSSLLVRSQGQNPAIEQYSPEADLAPLCAISRVEDTIAGTLPHQGDVVHSLLLHHFRNHASGARAVRLQELYEFAWLIQDMDDVVCEAMHAFCLRRPAVLDVVKTWLEASRACFSLEIPSAFRSVARHASVGEPVSRLVEVDGELMISLQPRNRL